ncbi:MAG TPA: hypothetical protein P5060_03705 [Candidatus Absconditabacterales bacterium]|nr:hypothetical protein [Candidatus Absconditabacterales bacterium]
MKKLIIITILFLAISQLVFAQDTVVLYHGMNYLSPLNGYCANIAFSYESADLEKIYITVTVEKTTVKKIYSYDKNGDIWSKEESNTSKEKFTIICEKNLITNVPEKMLKTPKSIIGENFISECYSLMFIESITDSNNNSLAFKVLEKDWYEKE